MTLVRHYHGLVNSNTGVRYDRRYMYWFLQSVPVGIPIQLIPPNEFNPISQMFDTLEIGVYGATTSFDPTGVRIRVESNTSTNEKIRVATMSAGAHTFDIRDMPVATGLMIWPLVNETTMITCVLAYYERV